jgi:transposase-like protein
MKCPQCKLETDQNKDGFTNAGSQRYRCKECGCRYTPEKKAQGYEKQLRYLAIRMYADGLNFRQTARHLGVSHTAVMNWVRDHASNLPEAPVPEEAYSVEMDELYTFIKDKKTGSIS